MEGDSSAAKSTLTQSVEATKRKRYINPLCKRGTVFKYYDFRCLGRQRRRATHLKHTCLPMLLALFMINYVVLGYTQGIHSIDVFLCTFESMSFYPPIMFFLPLFCHVSPIHLSHPVQIHLSHKSSSKLVFLLPLRSITFDHIADRAHPTGCWHWSLHVIFTS